MILEPRATKGKWRIRGVPQGWVVQRCIGTTEESWANSSNCIPTFGEAVGAFVQIILPMEGSEVVGQSAQELANCVNEITRSLEQCYKRCEYADHMRKLYHTLKYADPKWDGKNMVARANEELVALNLQVEQEFGMPRDRMDT